MADTREAELRLAVMASSLVDLCRQQRELLADAQREITDAIARLRTTNPVADFTEHARQREMERRVPLRGEKDDRA